MAKILFLPFQGQRRDKFHCDDSVRFSEMGLFLNLNKIYTSMPVRFTVRISPIVNLCPCVSEQICVSPLMSELQESCRLGGNGSTPALCPGSSAFKIRNRSL